MLRSSERDFDAGIVSISYFHPLIPKLLFPGRDSLGTFKRSREGWENVIAPKHTQHMEERFSQ